MISKHLVSNRLSNRINKVQNVLQTLETPIDSNSYNNKTFIKCYLYNAGHHSLECLLDEAHGGDAEEDVLQESGRTGVRVSGGY